MSDEEHRAEIFERCRGRLFSVAYGMLGEVAEAEDAVQDAYLRWRRLSSERLGEVRSPGDYLAAVVARLSIDRLRTAKARREEYVGPWLPEPLFLERVPLPSEADPAEGAVLGESLAMAFLVVLESLNPVERAVFLLGEVFDYGYGEISRVVGKSETNCRQIAHRARQHVAARRPRFESSREEHQRMTEQFMRALTEGDVRLLEELLAEDVTAYTDGGGQFPAARNPIYGADRVARLLLGVVGKAPPSLVVHQRWISGQPGLVAYTDGHPISVLTLDVAGGLIRAVHSVVNPEKLRNVPPLAEPGEKEEC